MKKIYLSQQSTSAINDQEPTSIALSTVTTHDDSFDDGLPTGNMEPASSYKESHYQLPDKQIQVYILK
jgi:hypothetical protein